MQQIFLKILVVAGLCLMFLFHSCSCEQRSPDVSHIEVDFELVPFYEDLFSFTPDSLEEALPWLREKYGTYLDAYSAGIIGIGYTDEDGFVDNMQQFLEYEPNQEVLDTIRDVFSNLDDLMSEFEQAFRYYRYYFPEGSIPDVYLHLSGFNQNVAADSTWMSVSVEQYLGRDCIFYEWLSVPVYLRRNKDPEKVVPDVMKALAMVEYAYNDSVNDLMNQMLYEGKLLYFVEKMIPTIEDTLLFDYSKEQMEWVKQHEEVMWSTMVEQKHLFSTERMTVQRYIGDSPFTYFFGSESPGRTGHFLGYRIVQSFMKRNQDYTLKDLMEMDNGHELFSEARYRP